MLILSHSQEGEAGSDSGQALDLQSTLATETLRRLVIKELDHAIQAESFARIQGHRQIAHVEPGNILALLRQADVEPVVVNLISGGVAGPLGELELTR